MTAPSSRPDAPDCPRCGSPGASFSTHPCNPPDTTAQQHADTVREALNFGYGGDPNYRPFYEDGITALDALLEDVERLTTENGRMEQELDAMDSRRAFEWERAEAAEREVERLTAERDEARRDWQMYQHEVADENARTLAAEALAERRGDALRRNIERRLREELPADDAASETERLMRQIDDGGDGDGAAT